MNKLSLIALATLVAGIGHGQILVEVVNVRAPNTPSSIADTITAQPGDIIFDTDDKEFQFYDGVTPGGISLNADPDGEIYVPYTTNYSASGTALLVAAASMSGYGQAAGVPASVFVKANSGFNKSGYTIASPINIDGNYDLICREYSASTLEGPGSYYFAAWGAYNASSVHYAFLMRNTGYTNTVATLSASSKFPILQGIAFLGDISNAVNAISYTFNGCVFKGKWYGADEPSTGSRVAYGCIFNNCSFGSGFGTVSMNGTENRGFVQGCLFQSCVIDGYIDSAAAYFRDCAFINGGLSAYIYNNPIMGKMDAKLVNCRFAQENPFDTTTLAGTSIDTVSVTLKNCIFENLAPDGWFSDTTLTAGAVKMYDCIGVWSGMTNTLATLVNCTDESGNAIPNQ
jgi:hypothetical protein